MYSTEYVIHLVKQFGEQSRMKRKRLEHAHQWGSKRAEFMRDLVQLVKAIKRETPYDIDHILALFDRHANLPIQNRSEVTKWFDLFDGQDYYDFNKRYHRL